MGAIEFQTWLTNVALDAGGLAAGWVRRDLRTAALAARFGAWTARNGGALGYIDRSLASRVEPFAARPWANGALVVAFTNAWGDLTRRPDLPPPPPGGIGGTVSLYACGPDYHQTGRAQLATLELALAARLGSGVTECCVDTRPAPEVFFALAAGLGALGRNGLLRTPQAGCRSFIGVLFTAHELPDRAPLLDFVAGQGCDACFACVRGCPTAALAADGAPIEVRRCRSWLSMERRGALTAAEQALLGDCLFGCDGCTAGCAPVMSANARLTVDLEWLLSQSPAELRRRIAGTALEHAGTTMLARNAAVALLNQVSPGPHRDLWLVRLATHSSPAVRETVLHHAAFFSET